MSLEIEVDLGAATPPYAQIHRQVAAHVAAGRLVAGDRLPTIRTLAADLGVAAGTVGRAYRELEEAGVVVSRRRTGTVIAASATAPDAAVQRAAAHFVAVAREAGLTDEACLDVVRGALGTAPGPSAGAASRPGSTPVERGGTAGDVGSPVGLPILRV